MKRETEKREIEIRKAEKQKDTEAERRFDRRKNKGQHERAIDKLKETEIQLQTKRLTDKQGDRENQIDVKKERQRDQVT